MRWIGLLAIASLAIGCGGNSTDTAPPDSAPAAADSPTTPAAAEGAGGSSAAAPVARPAAPPAPAFREITLPVGTMLGLDLQTAVASDTSTVEDAVRASLRQPVSVNGREVLPAGIQLSGAVTDVDRSGRVKGRARVGYRVNSLTYQGDRYEIVTAPIVHQAEATKKEDATKIAIGAGAGAALGAILGGGDGAAKGAAIGGAGGTGAVLATRGKEVRRGPGADVSTRLTAPLTLRVRL